MHGRFLLFGALFPLLVPAAGADVRALDPSGKVAALPMSAGSTILAVEAADGPQATRAAGILRQASVPAALLLSRTAAGHPGVERLEAGLVPGVLPGGLLPVEEANLIRFTVAARIGRTPRLAAAPSAAGEADALAREGYVLLDGPRASCAVRPATGVLRIDAPSLTPELLACLRAAGARFEAPHAALGTAADAFLPAATREELRLGRISLAYASARAAVRPVVAWFIRVLVLALILRLGFVLLAALVQAWRRRRPPPLDRERPCTVVVPAYNEGPVLAHALRSLLASDHRGFRVIVVDDGSTDDTLASARSVDDPRLLVLTKPNGGKASALNHGIARAETEIVVAVDADTVFAPDTLAALCRHFSDPRIGAVSGNVKVANRDRLLTKFQALEYVVSFNLDRRMADLFDCIIVVPGAIGAFRRQAIDGVGGFATDTLGEDADLTVAIRRAGWRIVYDDRALARTEAPVTLRDLLKQRVRWATGMLQIVWKHRAAVLNPRYGSLGLLGLPYLVFQMVFTLVGPFYDLALLAMLVRGDFGVFAASFVGYTFLDLVLAAIALRLDREPMRLLWVMLPQRFVYRQLTYYVLFVSLARALRGKLGGWGKLQRDGASLSASASR